MATEPRREAKNKAAGVVRKRAGTARVIAKLSPHPERNVAHELDDQKRSEQLLRLEHTITLRLSDAVGSRDAVRAALRTICDSEGWDVAELWLVAAGEPVLRQFEYWTTPGLE